MSFRGWNPNPSIEYGGPYPRYQLQEARTVLINRLRSASTIMLQVMPQCGIATQYGPAQAPPPLQRSQPASVKNTGYPTPTSHEATTSKIQTLHGSQNRPVESYTSSSQSRTGANDAKTPPKDDESNEDTSPAFYSNINSSGSKKKTETVVSRSAEVTNAKRKLDNDLDSPIEIAMKRAIVNFHDEVNACDNSMVHDISSKHSKPNVSDLKEEDFERKKVVSRNHIPFLSDSQSESEQDVVEVKKGRSPPNEKLRTSKNRIPFLDSQSSQSESEQETHKKSKQSSVQTEIEKIRTFKVWTSKDAYGSKQGNVQTVLKCDTCSYASKDKTTIKKHLEELCHYAASSYKAVIESSQICLVSVCSMLDVVNQKAAYKSQIVVCPECRDVFKDIFMCGLHHKKEHGSVNGMYSVCPVVAEEHYQHNACKACMSTFDVASRKALLEHFKKHPSHNPVNRKQQKDTIILYFCTFRNCRRQFYNNYSVSFSHVLSHLNRRSKTQNANERYSFTERQIVVPKVSHELPPFDLVGENALRKELEVMRRLRTFYNHELHSKSKRSRNIQEYRELCFKLGCTEDMDTMDGDSLTEQDSQDSQEEQEDRNTNAPQGWTY